MNYGVKTSNRLWDYVLAFSAVLFIYYFDQAKFFTQFVWTGYLLIPFLFFRRVSRSFLLSYAAVSSFFILLASYSGPHETRMGPFLYYRILGLIVLWLTCLLLSRFGARQVTESKEFFGTTVSPDVSQGFALFEVISPEEAGNYEFLFRDVNQNFEKMTGLLRDHVVGTLLSRLLSNENPLWVPLFSSVALTGQPLQFEWHSRSFSGNYDLLVYRPERGVLAIVFSEAVASGRRADQNNDIPPVDSTPVPTETASHQSGVPLQILVEFLQQGVLQLDREGRIVSANPAAETLFNASVDYLRGRTIIDRDFGFRHENGDPVRPSEHPVTTALHSGEAQCDVVMQLYNQRSKESHHIILTALPMLQGGGQVSQVLVLITDTTEQRRTSDIIRLYEEQLRTLGVVRAQEQHKSEEIYRTIVETLQEGILLLDTQGITLFVTSKMAEMLGYTVDEMHGQQFSDFMDEPERTVANGWLNQQKISMSEQNDAKFRRKDGTVFWGDISVSTVVDSNGISLGMLATITDTTERTQTLATARESVQRYRAFLSNISDALFMYHITDDGTCGRFMEVNEVACMLLGYTREELLLKSPLKILQEKAATTMAPLVKRLINDSQLIFEQIYVTKDLRQVLMEVSARTFMVDGRRVVISLARDISERGKVASSLHESLKQAEVSFDNVLQELTDFYLNAPFGYHLLNEDGVVVKVNDTELSWLGYSREEVVGKLRFEDLLTRDSVRACGERYPVLKKQGKIEDLNIELVRKDGKTFPAQLTLSVIRDKNGHFLKIGSFFSEMSSRRGEQVLLQETIEKLSSLEKSKDNSKDNCLEILQKSQMASMGEIIGAIAYQWRQPLTMLSVAAQDMPVVYDLGEFSREYLDDQVKKVVRLVDRMSGTMEGFRNSFRSDMKPETFSVNDAVTRTLTLVEASFLEKRISIEVAHDALLQLDSYENEFSQALLNILINARDAFKTVLAGDRAVLIRIFQEDSAVVVTVTDTSGGLSHEVIDRVFDAHSSVDDSDNVMRVGLFVAKNIIEKNMKGRLKVCNNENSTEFRIEL